MSCTNKHHVECLLQGTRPHQTPCWMSTIGNQTSSDTMYCFDETFLTKELIWHLKSIFQKAHKDGIIAFCYLKNLERASVSLLMLSAKQRNHWYHFLTSFVWRGLYQGFNHGIWSERSVECLLQETRPHQTPCWMSIHYKATRPCYLTSSPWTPTQSSSLSDSLMGPKTNQIVNMLIPNSQTKSFLLFWQKCHLYSTHPLYLCCITFRCLYNMCLLAFLVYINLI